MKNIRTPILLVTIVALAAGIGGAFAEKAHPAASLLFVQTAKGVKYDADAKTLTLSGVSPSVTFFTDRPQRTAGQMTVPGFIKIWGEGKDSFAVDPPNASLTVLSGDKTSTCVIELGEPKVDGKDLVYPVKKVLQGKVPKRGGASSLFIDSLLGPIVSGTTGQAALRTGAIGALAGSMDGNAGEGALIGAGIGIVGNAVAKSAAEQQ